MSWFSSFLKSSVAKQLFDLSGKILVAKLGAVGKELWEVAKTASYQAELTGKSGAEKKEMVVQAIDAKFKGAKKGIVDTVVQLAWMWVDSFVSEIKYQS